MSSTKPQRQRGLRACQPILRMDSGGDIYATNGELIVARILSYFHGALNWQVWQAGFLLLFSLQFDGEKPDKITRGACACNDDKVIFENL